METVYLCIVVFLLCLAVFDLFVGVSNDAVNFLQSAVGAKAANFRTVLIIASCGVILGAVMSSGMMDVARHGIMNPEHYTFAEVMTIFLAVMVTDVIILDVFNTLGMPTSTTVSLVFELLGGTFMLATLKMVHDSSLGFDDLLNSSEALKVIIAIFVSVAIAFVVGSIVMWISRIVFTFNYKKHLRYTVAIFGGIAFTALAYFIFMKGLAKSPFIPDDAKEWIEANTNMLLIYTFIGSSIVMEGLHLLKVDIFRFVVLMGTFALAMAFAGNDLVNFIGVPLAGLSSYQDFMANGAGQTPDTFMMVSLKESAKAMTPILMTAGIIMIIAMATSKKAKNVIKTSVDLSRQDEGDEMFGSSLAARSIVRFCSICANGIDKITPAGVTKWIDSRFNKKDIDLDEGAAFDMVRAAVNLVIASMLITFGTNHKLPLSTTYVTFMVAMGSSLADRAWSRESAVFRVTGVLSVIGGWFITAGVAFVTCCLVCLIMFYGGIIAKTLFMALVIYDLWRSNRNFAKKKAQEKKSTFGLMMRTRDPELVWDMLKKHVSNTQSYVSKFALTQYEKICSGLENNKPSDLRRVKHALRDEKTDLKKYRRQELLALKRIPDAVAVERNTWFHVGINASQQYIYCLTRMLEPVKEHVDNNFNPLPQVYIDEYQPVKDKIVSLMQQTDELISQGNYETYRDVLDEADQCKDERSALRKKHTNRMQESQDPARFQISLVYLNLLQESQQLLSNMRHQLRAAKKFMEE